IEAIGVSPALRRILVDDPTQLLSTFYGYPPDTTDGWLADLQQVRPFLDRTGLSFVEPLELTTVTSVGTLSVEPTVAGADPADLDHQVVAGLADAAPTLHRVLRL